MDVRTFVDLQSDKTARSGLNLVATDTPADEVLRRDKIRYIENRIAERILPCKRRASGAKKSGVSCLPGQAQAIEPLFNSLAGP